MRGAKYKSNFVVQAIEEAERRRTPRWLWLSAGGLAVLALILVGLYIVTAKTLAEHGDEIMCAPLAAGTLLIVNLFYKKDKGFRRPFTSDVRDRLPSALVLIFAGIIGMFIWQQWSTSYELAKRFDEFCKKSNAADLTEQRNEYRADAEKIRKEMGNLWIKARSDSENRCY